MTKSDYEYIRDQLVFAPRPALAAAAVAVNAALLGLALTLLAQGTASSRWIAQAILPVVFFQAFSLLHECGHGSFSRRRGVNTWVGHYASVLCFMPYWPWKYVHAQHHAWTGNADHDPGLTIVKRARDTGELPWPLRFTWRLWLPLAALVQHVLFWTHPLRSGGLSRRRRLRCAVSSLLLPATYGSLHVLAPQLFSLEHFGLPLAAYLALVEFVNFPHHLGLTSARERMPLWQQHASTRSCAYPPVVSELLVLNFNFHIEHHLFPTLPWYRLRKARTLVKRALGESYNEAGGFSWHHQSRRRPLVDVILARAPSEQRSRPAAAAVAGAPPSRPRMKRGGE